MMRMWFGLEIDVVGLPPLAGVPMESRKTCFEGAKGIHKFTKQILANYTQPVAQLANIK